MITQIHKKLQSSLPGMVLLGGSHMRGTSTSFSDVDFFLVPDSILQFIYLVLKRKKIQNLLVDIDRTNVHICMPRNLQQHFFFVCGTDIDGQKHILPIKTSIMAYNNLKMAYKTLIFIHSLLILGQRNAVKHYLNKLRKYIMLLELSNNNPHRLLPLDIDFFDTQKLEELLPEHAQSTELDNASPLDTYFKMLIDLSREVRKPLLLRVYQFFLALFLGHPRSAVDILSTQDVKKLPNITKRALSTQHPKEIEKCLNYAKFTYFWLIIKNPA